MTHGLLLSQLISKCNCNHAGCQPVLSTDSNTCCINEHGSWWSNP